MTRTMAALVAWACTAWLVVTPVAALYMLIDIDRFSSLAIDNLALPIQWYTVSHGQWIALWAITAGYLSLGYAGAWFLRKAFMSFARGAWFDVENSRHLRRYAALLISQGIAKPVHFGLASVVLSLNHPQGERLLTVSVGSNEALSILAGLVLWVLADLLVKGIRADAENRQFV